MDTLEIAKNELRQYFKEGIDCPCCGQMVKLYRRKLNAGMCVGLIRLYRLGEGYHHLSDIEPDRKSGCELAKLKHWGLVKQNKNDDPEKRTSGMWRITKKGIGFINLDFTLPSYVNVFNTKSYGFSEKHITIKQALGVKFDYSELMGYLV